MKLEFRVLFYVIAFPLWTFAQPSMTVNSAGVNSNPFWLAENIISPIDSTILNIDNSGNALVQSSSTQLGYFEANDTTFPIQSGVVMVAAQNVSDVIAALNGTGNNVTFTDSELANILTQLGSSGYAMKDMASIEFSFIARSDSFKLNYVFGSHEYDGYTCSNFNDVLGIFLEGPKVDSSIALPGSSVIKNIAVVPNSNIPVAVNTVNSGSPSGPFPGTNCLSANPNYVSDSQYFNPSNGSITTLDGYTDKFAAKAEIQCGALYTVRIKIANVSDASLSPAIFIESGSLIGNENNGSVCSNSLPDYIPINGLEVYYPLDTLGSSNPSASGDSSVGRDLGFFNHHWNAGSSYIPKTNRFGVPGGAMSYTQNIAQTPFSGVLGTESRSVSVWVKHKGYSSDPVFFQYGSQVAGKRFSGHVNYNCNGVGVGSAFSTTTNNQALDTNWHHIVYVLDTSQCTGSCSVTDVDVYVDGVMYPNCNVFNGSTAINTIGTFNLQFIFGNNTIADSNRLALDDFGMWNRPLTQGEILDLYSGSSSCIVFDTIPVFDTSFVDVFDTIPVFDTSFVDVFDTIPIFDTSFVDVFDTIPVFDTTYVTQIDTLYLTVTDTLIIDVSLIGINPPTFEYQLRVYPNPTNDFLYVDVPPNMFSQLYGLEIVNALGQSMYSHVLNQQQLQINLNSFASAGTYTLVIKTFGGTIVDTRIIVLQ